MLVLSRDPRNSIFLVPSNVKKKIIFSIIDQRLKAAQLDDENTKTFGQPRWLIMLKTILLNSWSGRARERIFAKRHIVSLIATRFVYKLHHCKIRHTLGRFNYSTKYYFSIIDQRLKAAPLDDENTKTFGQPRWLIMLKTILLNSWSGRARERIFAKRHIVSLIATRFVYKLPHCKIRHTLGRFNCSTKYYSRLFSFKRAFARSGRLGFNVEFCLSSYPDQSASSWDRENGPTRSQCPKIRICNFFCKCGHRYNNRSSLNRHCR